MSSPVSTPGRRRLDGRRPDTVARLLDAAVTEIERAGYDALTMRNVARGAGVSPATAYTHFASKEHLLAEVYWRRLAALDPLEFDAGWSVRQRVEAAVAPVALLLAAEPGLAAGVTTALLAHDPDVVSRRNDAGALMAQRLQAALGDELPETVQLALTLALIGGLLSAGLGVLDSTSLPGLLADFAALVEDRS